MSKGIFVAFVLFSFAAFADSKSILGKWELDIESNVSKYHMTLEVTERSSTFGMQCTRDEKTVGVRVSVPTKVEGNVFHILAAAQEGAENCRVGVKLMDFTFEVSETKLRLNSPDGEITILNRAP